MPGDAEKVTMSQGRSKGPNEYKLDVLRGEHKCKKVERQTVSKAGESCVWVLPFFISYFLGDLSIFLIRVLWVLTCAGGQKLGWPHLETEVRHELGALLEVERRRWLGPSRG